MQPEDLKNLIMECFKDGDFVTHLQERLLAPIISRHEDALREKDREIAELKSELSAARDDIDDLEQYSRRNSLTISGVPESDRESTDALVIDVAKAAGVDVTVADIDRTHRFGKAKNNKPRQIIAKFVSYNKRQQVYEARKDIKAGRVPGHTTLTQQVLASTYIAENLTKKNQHIVFLARQLRRKNKIHSVWTNSCRIKIRTRQDGPTRIVRTMTDLRNIVGDDPELLEALRGERSETALPGPAPDSPPGAVAGTAPAVAGPGAAPPAAADGSGAAVSGRRGRSGTVKPSGKNK